MCEKGKRCQKPEQLKGKPRDCSPEQVKECHGDVKKHPCTSRKTAK
jgi:transposase